MTLARGRRAVIQIARLENQVRATKRSRSSELTAVGNGLSSGGGVGGAGNGYSARTSALRRRLGAFSIGGFPIGSAPSSTKPGGSASLSSLSISTKVHWRNFSSSSACSSAAGEVASSKQLETGASMFEELSADITHYTSIIAQQIQLRGIDAREQVLAELLAAEDVWDQPQRANRLSREHADLRRILSAAQELEDERAAAMELADLAREEEADASEVLADCLNDLLACRTKAESFHVQLLLDGPADSKGAYIEVSAGAGGTEACDFAENLTNMYIKWAGNSGWKASLTEVNPSEEAGYRNATVKIDGHNAYGWAKAESGVHRMVRISEYDSNGRRQTCFAKVAVLPAVDDDDDDPALDIPPGDLRIDTFRASGAGGQHVNTTESAVRITHLPTGIVAQSQDQRSQLQNRKTAMSVLKSRILQVKLDQEIAEKNEFANTLGENTWGNQIRSYVLHPYKLVKDHRTNHETSQAQAVLDGDVQYLTPFMQAHLVSTCASEK